MSSTTGNNGLLQLIDLQQIDTQINALRKRVDSVPGELARLEEQEAERAETLEQSQLALEEDQRLRRQLEGEVALLREKLTKFKTQLMEVKTNREYQAVLHEISTTEEEIGRAEDRILESMIGAEDLAGKFKESETTYKENVAEIADQRKEIQDFSSKAEKELADLESRRAEIVEELPEELRDHYERLVAARGTALAEARDESCQVCHVRLRPQLFNEVKTGQQIATCESCNRILYFARS